MQKKPFHPPHHPITNRQVICRVTCSVFLVGEVPDPELMAELREEHLSHGDLVQVSVRDHYTALSYKTLSGFVWVNR